MKSKIIKYIVSVINALFIAVLSEIIASNININTSNYSFIWEHLKYALNYEIKSWWILIFILVYCISIKCINRRTKIKLPDFTNYTTETVDGIEWKWEWMKDGRTWRIVNLHSYCPRDKSILDDNFCPICKSRVDIDERKVEATIRNKLDKEYPNPHIHL